MVYGLLKTHLLETFFKYDLMMGLDEQLKDQCVGFSGI